MGIMISIILFYIHISTLSAMDIASHLFLFQELDMLELVPAYIG